jgi:hypothetical protein
MRIEEVIFINILILLTSSACHIPYLVRPKASVEEYLTWTLMLSKSNVAELASPIWYCANWSPVIWQAFNYQMRGKYQRNGTAHFG